MKISVKEETDTMDVFVRKPLPIEDLIPGIKEFINPDLKVSYPNGFAPKGYIEVDEDE